MAGSRFEEYVRSAMREAGDMTLADLARGSGINETNWHTWFRGEHRPRANTLRLAAPVLNRTPEQMLASWDGERPQKSAAKPLSPDEVARAIDRQTEAIVQQTKMLALVLSRLVPSEDEPEPDELAAQRMYDERRRPRPVPDPVKP
jgi:transcriptional regulator with XRE-family HTH domain